jgi:Mlc titration factor MtfA (ptsG expression regulator)
LRIDRPQDRTFVLLVGLVIVLAAAGLGGAGGGAPAALLGALLGLAAALSFARTRVRRGARRRAVLHLPFHAPWDELLRTRYDHYLRLPEDLKARFQGDLRIFLAEKRVTGIEVAVTDELRLLVAASAITLSVGWPEYEWDQLTEVLLYPQDFDRDYTFESGDLAGQTHPWGTVILSVPALLESFADPDDGYHVGIHEFTHLLDVDQTRFDGIPVGLGEAQSREWAVVMEKEMDRLRRGKSVLDPYGATDAVEFLAVAVEAFFEVPLALRKRHREVYAILSSYFAQDPAAWDDARGLVR